MHLFNPRFLAAITLGFSLNTVGFAQEDAPEKPDPAPAADEKPLEERVAYFLGTNVGQHMKGQIGLDSIDYESFLSGLKDVMEGNDLKMTEEQIRATMEEFQAKQEEKAAAKAKEAAAKGAAYLAENATREGVETTKSGLQYEVVHMGDGKKPTAEDTVSVHYKGTLIDGTEFDSSHKRGKPAQFPVGGVIPGWTEALQLMPVGSKFKLHIPSALGYGERGAGGDIGPNETLVFEVELLEIK